MGIIIGVVLLAIGSGLLWQGWRTSQTDPTSVTATPLGVTGGAVALGGLAVTAGGWDVIGQIAAAVSLVVLVVGLSVTAVRRARRSPN